MAGSAGASLRLLQQSCLRHGLSSPRLGLRWTHPTLAAAVAPGYLQRRHESSAKEPASPKDSAKRPENMNPEPKYTFRQAVGITFVNSFRNLGIALSPRGIRSAYNDLPVVTSLLLIALLATFGIGAYALHSYMSFFYGPNFSQFPDPVANTLRRAIYCTNIKPDPELALRYYKKAMQQCIDLDLDPFSDPVLGIRMYVAQWLESIHNFKLAIDVLESVLQDCKKWVAVMEQSNQEGKVDDRGRLVQPDSEPVPVGKASDDTPPPETLWRKRERLLAKAIGTSVKLGALYADEHVMEPEKSHLHLVWAVETALKEFQRRHVQGPKPGEEAWLTPQELGGAMESLAHNYERRSQFHLAIPLLMQALRLCDSPCHRAVIMNNLSAVFAQQPIFSPAQPPSASSTIEGLVETAVPTSRKECFESAENWAQNALDHAQDVTGEERTAECDEACAVAMCNLADVAAMLGKPDVARAKYRECIEMSSKMDFKQGVKHAQEGLAKLTSTPVTKV
ncbi:hypothetical protein CDD81_7217 [Ophiocordyceps australis]|uniref:TPR domain-containing protein n=1 Tax=Ophiocordyceps australis TaxID=1399860 RepID=A0A2C5XYL7_9HYPO|nr:hypothetical protein CDD81_7217 [Ophiocordyceps australis]